jgi:wyosine [tRNA(Phe)-imidazoG37] synthetase (radical SAM superfamily)
MNEQKNVVEVSTIINELKEHLHDKIDVITITANGEPTLYPYLDELIDELNKIKNGTQTLILTNSSTLVNEKVFNSLLKLDQVKLSLDAVSNSVFKRIDRPHFNIDIEQIVQKVIEFSKVYKGKLFIEILLVKDLNDTKEEIQKLNDVLMQLRVTRVDIGTIDRPPAYPVSGVSYKELHEISHLFDSALPIHIASRVHAEPNNASYDDEEILNTLDKRPLTAEDIDLLFDEESKKRLDLLIKNSRIAKKSVGNLEFFILHENEERKRAK